MTAAENTTAQKRTRDSLELEDDGTLFRVHVSHSGALRTLIENISHVLKAVELHIVETPEFTGIRIETFDDLKVCLVLGQLPCQVSSSTTWKKQYNNTICLSVEMLLLTLRQVDVQYSVEFEQKLGEEDIVTIRSHESLTGQDELEHNLRSLVSQNAGQSIKLMDFPVSYSMEIDLTTLRQFLKMCESIKADDINIAIETQPGGGSCVRMAANGEGTMSVKRSFRNLAEDGAAAIQDTDGDATAAPSTIYSEFFATKFMNSFIRSMNRTNVTFLMAERAPIHVSYPIGVRDASVTFILAPRQRDD